MFKRIAGAALVIGAALTVLPAGAFAQDRDDYRYRAPVERSYYGEYRAPYRDRYVEREYRERVRQEQRAERWREHEWRERERHERHYDRDRGYDGSWRR